MRKFTSGYLITWYRLLPSPASVQLCVLMVLAVFQGTMASYKKQLPAFIEMESNITATTGSRVELKCGARHLGTKQIIWKKVDTNDHNILTVGDMVFTDDEAVDIQHKREGHKELWNLVLKPVKKEHRGLYECQISTQEDLKAYITLTVIDVYIPMGKDKGITLTGKSYVDKGEAIVLICNITGDGFLSSVVDWFKDGKMINPNIDKGIHVDTHHVHETRILHSVLTIFHSKMSDMGIYVCRSNAGSEVRITSKAVMVLNGNSPKIPRSNIGDKYVNPGDTVLDILTKTPTTESENQQGDPDDNQKFPREIINKAETDHDKREEPRMANGVSRPQASSSVSLIVSLVCLLTLWISSFRLCHIK